MVALDKAHGLDLSKHNIHKGKRWVKPESSPYPIDFVIQRLGYGMMVDQRYDVLTEDIQQVEIRGAYHYYSSAVPWKVQADMFLRLALNSPANTKYHNLWLDYEGHGSYNWLTSTTLKEAHKFLEYIRDNVDDKVEVGLYTNPSHYVNHIQKYENWAVDWPLWLAQYWYEPSPFKKPGWSVNGIEIKYPFNTQTYWQYSADTNYMGEAYGATSPHVDLDVSTKTPQELKIAYGITENDGGAPITPTTQLPEGVSDSIQTSIKVETEKIKKSAEEIERIIKNG